MGFMDTLQKVANSTPGAGLAKVESPAFPMCVLLVNIPYDKDNASFTIDKNAIEIAPKGEKFTKYEFKKSDIEVMRYINSGNSWARYYVKFKDGKSCFMVGDAQLSPSDTVRPENKDRKIEPLERYFGDIISFR